MDQERFGKFILNLRKEKNLTQNDVAQKLGVTDKAVSKWERGLGCPDISLLVPLSNILGISVNELLLQEKIDNVITKEKAENAVKQTIKLSDNKIKKGIKKNKILKVIVIFILILLLLISILIINKENDKRKKEEKLNEIVLKVENNLKSNGFEKESTIKLSNYVLTKDNITYVVPDIKYQKNGLDIYKEILSYEDYKNKNGITIYFSDNAIYAYSNQNKIKVKCSIKGSYIDNKDNTYKLNFYIENENVIKKRILDSKNIWLTIYGN